VDRSRGGGRLRRGGLRADRRRPSDARRARPAAGRGGGGRTGFDVAGAADLELVAVGARAFGGGAARTPGARGSGHSVYAAGPAGLRVPEPVGLGVGAVVLGSGVGAVVLGSGIGFCVVVVFAFRFGVCVSFRFLFAVAVCVAVAVAVCFAVAVAVCVLLAVGFLLAIIFGFVVAVVVGFLVRVGVRARLAVRVGEFGLIRYRVSGCVTGLVTVVMLGGPTAGLRLRRTSLRG
jgi:hypothetical protein